MYLVGVLCTAVWLFLANEARKETFYLCRNFSEGLSSEDLKTQLDTANLSWYVTERLNVGYRVVLSSPVNLHYFQCTIVVNEAEEVVSATFD